MIEEQHRPPGGHEPQDDEVVHEGPVDGDWKSKQNSLIVWRTANRPSTCEMSTGCWLL